MADQNSIKTNIVRLYGKRLDHVLTEWQKENPGKRILQIVPTLTDNPRGNNYAQELREVAILFEFSATEPRKAPQFGSMAGQFHMAEDFKTCSLCDCGDRIAELETENQKLKQGAELLGREVGRISALYNDQKRELSLRGKGSIEEGPGHKDCPDCQGTGRHSDGPCNCFLDMEDDF